MSQQLSYISDTSLSLPHSDDVKHHTYLKQACFFGRSRSLSLLLEEIHSEIDRDREQGKKKLSTVKSNTRCMSACDRNGFNLPKQVYSTLVIENNKTLECARKCQISRKFVSCFFTSFVLTQERKKAKKKKRIVGTKKSGTSAAVDMSEATKYSNHSVASCPLRYNYFTTLSGNFLPNPKHMHFTHQ